MDYTGDQEENPIALKLFSVDFGHGTIPMIRSRDSGQEKYGYIS